MAYTPNQEYSDAYDAVTRRLRSNYAKQRGNLQQDLATRGVSTSGVSSIPLAQLGNEEELAIADTDARFALDQVDNVIQDRRAAEQHVRNRELAQLGYDAQDAIQRRLAGNSLKAAVIGGTIGLAGNLFRGGGGTAARR